MWVHGCPVIVDEWPLSFRLTIPTQSTSLMVLAFRAIVFVDFILWWTILQLTGFACQRSCLSRACTVCCRMQDGLSLMRSLLLGTPRWPLIERRVLLLQISLQCAIDFDISWGFNSLSTTSPSPTYIRSKIQWLMHCVSEAFLCLPISSTTTSRLRVRRRSLVISLFWAEFDISFQFQVFSVASHRFGSLFNSFSFSLMPHMEVIFSGQLVVSHLGCTLFLWKCRSMDQDPCNIFFQ